MAGAPSLLDLGLTHDELARLWSHHAGEWLTRPRDPDRWTRHNPGIGYRSRAETFAAVRRADRVCRYCLRYPAETVDHVLPRAEGGTHREVNLVGACPACNQAKGPRTPREAQMLLHLPLRLVLGVSAVQYLAGPLAGAQPAGAP